MLTELKGAFSVFKKIFFKFYQGAFCINTRPNFLCLVALAHLSIEAAFYDDRLVEG